MFRSCRRGFPCLNNSFEQLVCELFPASTMLCETFRKFSSYPRESQEMVFDAHDRGFAFFKGACRRGIYDNMRTAVETILVGREAEAPAVTTSVSSPRTTFSTISP